MPQQSRPTGAVKGQKTTKVQRILEDESLRQSVEVVWKRERSQAESLGVLARAKALNEFIRKGLLAEVEADNAAAGGSSPPPKSRTAAVRASASKPAAAGVTKAGPTSAGAPRPASLTSRITAQESSALLDLLLSDEVAAAEAVITTPVPPSAAAAAAAADSSGDSLGGSSSRCCGGASTSGPSEPTPACEAADETSSPTTSSTCEPQQQQQQQQQPKASSSDSGSSGSTVDMLDDVIGLLNAPGVMQHRASNTHDEPHPSKPPSQQQQQQQPPQQQQPASTLSPMPPAACREAHRQAFVRPLHQQQEELRAAATKHASINRAWEGFYNFWGPRAASTIQQAWRAYKARQRHLQLREAAVALQSLCRGHLVRTGPRNLLRLQREQQRQEQEQQRQQQQQEREVLEAATVLQCVVRGWAARRARCCLAAASAAAAAAVEEVPAVKQLSSSISSVPSSTTCRASDSTDSCSRGSSRQSHSRGSNGCSSEASAAAHPCSLLEAGDETEWQETEPSSAYVLPGLLIRHAAEKRTASHGGADAGQCKEELARQLVERAGQLGAAEGQKAAELGTRSLLVCSSARELKSAMQVAGCGCRSARPTM